MAQQLLQGNLGYSYASNHLPGAVDYRTAQTYFAPGRMFLCVFHSHRPAAWRFGRIETQFHTRLPAFRHQLPAGGNPNFFAGLALIYIFGVVLKILPTGGMYNSSGTQTTADLLRHMVLPMLVLSFQQIGAWIRYMRSSMVEVFQEDYLRTARAKGLRPFAVIRKHAFKNSLLPVITVIGMSIPGLVGGAVVTEQVFSWPGIGSLMIQSIAARDYPVIMGITVLVAMVVLIINLITDVTMAYSTRGSVINRWQI